MERKSRYIINFSPLNRFFSAIIFYFTLLCAVILLRLYYRLQIKGRKNLKGIKSSIVAANHTLYVETVIACMPFFPRRILFSALEETIHDMGPLSWYTRRLGGFGIPKNNPVAAIGPIKEALERGYSINVYPEGELTYMNQQLLPFVPGAFHMSILFDVPVVPCVSVIKRGFLRKYIPFWPPKVIFVVEKPIYPETFKSRSVSKKEQIREMMNYTRGVMQEAIDREGGCKDLVKKKPPSGEQEES